MGKGGTKFVGDALGARAKCASITRVVKPEMHDYFNIEKNPELEEEIRALGGAALPLPSPSDHRPHVYLDLTRQGTQKSSTAVYRLVIELFENEGLLAVNIFKGRCCTDAPESFLGTLLERRTPVGLTSRANNLQNPHRGGSGLQVKRYPRLCHMEPGAVSIEVDGGRHFFISFETCHAMDRTHQVVGRVIPQCRAELDRLRDEVKTDTEGKLQQQQVVVSSCGITDGQGGGLPAVWSAQHLQGDPRSEETKESIEKNALRERKRVREGVAASVKSARNLLKKQKAALPDFFSLSSESESS